MENKNYIGKTCTVQSAKNKSYVGLTGVIVNETKNTLVVSIDGTEKTILKNGTTFAINNKTMQGKNILKRAEERIKLRGKKDENH